MNVELNRTGKAMNMKSDTLCVSRVDDRAFYIDGVWHTPSNCEMLDNVNPATESVINRVACGTAADVDIAVAAARHALPGWADTDQEHRFGLLRSVADVYARREDELVNAISVELGAPVDLARRAQFAGGLANLQAYCAALSEMEFRQPSVAGSETDVLIKEPVGVCALITPWNWPMNQVTLKVGAALAAGATMVLKPSEHLPITHRIFSEVLHEAGIPAGVFNMVNGTGDEVGSHLVAHDDVDLISFTGSTRAGLDVGAIATSALKRMTLELGGNNPAIVLRDADPESAIQFLVEQGMRNSGQSCNAPSRILVDTSLYEHAVEIAARVASKTAVGAPHLPGNHIGPVATAEQYARVQEFIAQSLAAGGRIVAGGPGRPEGVETGYYVCPTVFANADDTLPAYSNEVFGPVICIRPFHDVEEAISLANDTEYGLAAYVHGRSYETIRYVTSRLQVGMVHINGHLRAPGTPFGGYKMSGVGREGGKWGINDFLELKSVSGWPTDSRDGNPICASTNTRMS